MYTFCSCVALSLSLSFLSSDILLAAQRGGSDEQCSPTPDSPDSSHSSVFTLDKTLGL